MWEVVADVLSVLNSGLVVLVFWVELNLLQNRIKKSEATKACFYMNNLIILSVRLSITY